MARTNSHLDIFSTAIDTLKELARMKAELKARYWPRDNKGHFLPHVGYPKGLEAWMNYNANRRS
jgi:hypothetical protein